MIEADIEDYLVRRVQRAGGAVRKVRWLGRRGAPDRAVFLPNLGLVWVELKKPGKAPTSQQAQEHGTLRRFGQRVLVIDSIALVDALLDDEWDAMKRAADA